MGVFRAVRSAWVGGDKKDATVEATEKVQYTDDDDEGRTSDQRRSLDSQRPSGNEKSVPHGSSGRASIEVRRGRASIELGRLAPSPKADAEAPTGLKKVWVSFHYGRPTRVELTNDEADVDDLKKRLMVVYPRHLGHLEAFEFGLKLLPHSAEVIPEDTSVEHLVRGNSAASPIYVDIPVPTNRGPNVPATRSPRPPSPATGPLPLSPVFSPDKDDTTHHRRYSLNSGIARSSARNSFGSEDSGDDVTRRTGSVDRDSNSSFRFDSTVRNSPNQSPTIMFGSTIAVPPRVDTAKHLYPALKDGMGGAGERPATKPPNRNQWKEGASPIPPQFQRSPPRPTTPGSSRSQGESGRSKFQDADPSTNPLPPTSAVVFTHSLTPAEILKLLEGLDNNKENGGLDHSKGMRNLPLPPRPTPASQRPMLSLGGKDVERRGTSLDLPRPSFRPIVTEDPVLAHRRGSLDLPRPKYLASIAEKNEVSKDKWKLFGRRKKANQDEAGEGKEKRKKVTSMWRSLWSKRQHQETDENTDGSGPLTPGSNHSSIPESGDDLPSVSSWAARRGESDMLRATSKANDFGM